MSRTRLRTPLEVAIGVVVAATIVTTALRSGSIEQLVAPADHGRFVLLGVLAALAVTYVGAVRPPLRAGPLYWLVAAIVVIAAASAAWSPAPATSLAHSLALATLAAAAGVLAAAAATTRTLACAVAAGLAAGSLVLAIAGFVLLAVDSQQATFVIAGAESQRYRGIGANANTISALAAVVAAPTAWLWLTQRAVLGALGAVTVVLLAVTVAVSGSRGGGTAMILALVVVAAAAARPTRERVALGCVAGAMVAAAFAHVDARFAEHFAERPPSGASESTTLASGPALPTIPPRYPGNPGRLDSEVGSTVPGFSSGRFEAWRGVLEQGLPQAVAGYGYGMEDVAFEDRYAGFQGEYAENSILGAFLELGIVGAALLLTAAIAAAAAALQAVRNGNVATRTLAAAAAGAVAAGLVLAIVQSFLLAPGAVATLPFWLAALLAAALAAPSVQRPRRRQVAIAAFVLAVAAAAGVAEARAHTAHERRTMRDLVAVTGPLDGPKLESFRITTLFDCFGYTTGRTAWDVERCYDRRGRLVEVIDRRGSTVNFATVRYDPDAAPERVPPPEIRALLRRTGGELYAAVYLGGFPQPFGLMDSTPIVIKKWLPVARAALHAEARGSA